MPSKSNNHIEIATVFEHARMKVELDSGAQSHLDDCEFCRARLSWMAVLTDLGPQDLGYEPPHAAMDKVLRLGRNASRLKQIRNVIVALTSDSFRSLAPAGVRQGAAATRQLTYEAGDLEVGILVRKSDERTWTVLGRLRSKSSGPIKDPSAHVNLVVNGDHVRTSSLSSLGEFVFADLPESQYSLQISFLDLALHIPSLRIADTE